MPRLDRLPDASRKNLLALPVHVNETTPFVRPARPLAACRLAIVTTAGLHRRGDRPFGPGEQTYRVIPSETPPARGCRFGARSWMTVYGFGRRDINRSHRCVYLEAEDPHQLLGF